MLVRPQLRVGCVLKGGLFSPVKSAQCLVQSVENTAVGCLRFKRREFSLNVALQEKVFRQGSDKMRRCLGKWRTLFRQVEIVFRHVQTSAEGV